MLITVSKLVVLIVGIAICLVATLGLYSPKKLVQWLQQIMHGYAGIYSAVLVRFVLGLALVIAASVSRYPSVFTVLGWIAIFAAIAIVLMGRERLRQFVDWWVRRFSPALIRVWLLFAIAFGSILIYGVA